MHWVDLERWEGSAGEVQRCWPVSLNDGTLSPCRYYLLCMDGEKVQLLLLSNVETSIKYVRDAPEMIYSLGLKSRRLIILNAGLDTRIGTCPLMICAHAIIP